MKILMIALDYHGYSAAIADEFRAAGHDVTRYDIIEGGFGARLTKLLKPQAFARRTEAYHRDILARESGKGFDWVFFLQCHHLSLETMAAFREAFAGARFTLYNWDSITTHDYRPYRPMFDDIYTFDPVDAQTLGVRYLPLFCMREFQRLPKLNTGKPAVYVVGSIANLQRYVVIDTFRTYCRDQGIDFLSYMRIRPPLYPGLWRTAGRPKGVSFRSIQPAKFHEMMAKASATFDFANHVQAGYTMRVIENLCAGKKIITNNERVRMELFFSPDRFHIYDGLDFAGVKEFLETPLADPAADFGEYHIQTFAGHLMEGTSHALPLRTAPAAAAALSA